jgi:cytochrome c biogenesis protein
LNLERESEITLLRAFLNKIGSIRWTLAIMLLLAGVGAVGTFLPRRQDVEAYEKVASPLAAKIMQALGFADFFHSMWFRVLLVFLVLNLLACVIIRIPAVVAALRGQAALRREPVLVLDAGDESMNRIAGSLKALGFREKRGGDHRIFSKGTVGYAMTLLSHGSILIIIISSFTGSIFGFVATKRIHVGDVSSTAYNWKTRDDMKLPFEIHPGDLIFLPNPVSVRLGVRDLKSGERAGTINSYEGGTFKVPGLRGSVTLERFDVSRKQFKAWWIAPDGTRTEFGSGSAIGDSGIALVLLAYATWPERQVLVKTELRVNGELIKAGEISVNHPMSHDGMIIYLTDYGKNQYGFPYAGFQFVRDPGKAGVWVGCIMFILCVTAALFVRHSCVVIVEEEGSLSVYLSSRGDRESIVMKLRCMVNGKPVTEREVTR